MTNKNSRNSNQGSLSLECQLIPLCKDQKILNNFITITDIMAYKDLVLMTILTLSLKLGTESSQLPEIEVNNTEEHKNVVNSTMDSTKLPDHHHIDFQKTEFEMHIKECTTTSGPDANKTCIFPFKFAHVTYNRCTTDGNDPGDVKAWCSTKVDDSGKHVGGEGNWGSCELKCQTFKVWLRGAEEFVTLFL